MHSVKSLSLLALAGTALAAPQGWGSWSGKYWRGGNNDNSNNDNSNVATNVAVVTAYTTVTWGGNYNKPTATAAPQAPKPTEPAAPQQPEKSAPVADASSTWAAWSSAAPAPSASAPAKGSNDGSYMSVVQEWRSKMGLSALTEDSTLAANAMKTAVDGNGEMKHELNPGSMGQVLAPGQPGDFEKCFVGGWLCERPSIPGLDGICDSMSAGWAYGGQTGHADILTSASYSKIGCGNAAGIWACDLA